MDLRLVTPALVVWLVTLLGLHGPSWSMPAVLVIGGMICAAALFAYRRWKVAWRMVGIVVIGAGMAVTCALALWLRLETRDAHPMSGMSGKATVTMSIRDDPRNFGPAQRGQVTTRVTVLAVGERRVPSAVADVVARAPGWVGLLPGQRVRVLVSMRAPRGGDLSVARLAASGPPTMLGRPPPLQRGAGIVRTTLQQNSAQALTGESAGLLPGLVIGDESALSQDVRDQFRAAGLSHLTAVSGANFALTCGAAIALIRLIGGSPKVAAVSGVIVIVGFVVLVRPSPSVLRAAMMGGVGLLALLSTRRARAVPALGVAVIGGLLWWPELASAPGFALSVVATAGLVLIAPSIRDMLREWRIPPVAAEVLAIAIAAQVVTAPLIAMISGTFNVVSILANVVVAPVVGVISVVGTLAALIGLAGEVGAVVAQVLLRAMSPELWWMITVARVLGGLSWAAIEIPDGLAGMVLVMAFTVLGAALVNRRSIGWVRRRTHRRRNETHGRRRDGCDR
ncbi:ComEC/Rec2 family competence protein [Gordonia sputi]